MPGDQELRSLLAADRTVTEDRIAGLSRDLDAIVEAARLVATDDEHDPEGSTIAFERSQTTKFLEDARKHLAELDDALVRLSAGGHLSCVQCGEVIDPARLEARPTARTCIRCAT
jgi:RNA polymerase-binding transcription factor DksA